MTNPTKDNATMEGGVIVGRAGGRETTKQNKVLRCGVHRTSKLRRELEAQGLALRDTSGHTQCQTLLRVLQYLGDRGINTPEGVACGFYRIATRIQELEADGWLIASRRERLLGQDGLVHVGIARYVLIGKRTDMVCPQLDLGFEVPA